MLTQDGRISFLPFDMVPDTIVVNGFRGLVGSDGLSVVPIKELVNLGYFQPSAGSPLDPLRVEGKLLTGKLKAALWSSTYNCTCSLHQL